MKLIPKGILKAIILKELSKKPMHGYELMKDVKKVTKFWQPSPGTIYPLLNSMRIEGLIKCKPEGRRKLYYLTKKGRKLLKKMEKMRNKLKDEFIEKFSNVFEVDRKQIEKFHQIFSTKISKDLRAKLIELSILCMKLEKEQKGKSVLKLLDSCINRLKSI